jgi:hypothetical protein
VRANEGEALSEQRGCAAGPKELIELAIALGESLGEYLHSNQLALVMHGVVGTAKVLKGVWSS